MTSNQPGPSVLIASEDAPTRLFLADNLTADGMHVSAHPTADAAWCSLAGRYPDAVVLDARLPDHQALVLLEHLRNPAEADGHVDLRVPVRMLGAQSDLDRVRALELGADDAIACPFSYPELRARLSALLRRAQQRPRCGPLRVGGLEIDPVSREVRLAGERVQLATKEFALLTALAAEPDRVFTKTGLLRGVWGFKQTGDSRTLDSHAYRLRPKPGRLIGA